MILFSSLYLEYFCLPQVCNQLSWQIWYKSCYWKYFYLVTFHLQCNLFPWNTLNYSATKKEENWTLKNLVQVANLLFKGENSFFTLSRYRTIFPISVLLSFFMVFQFDWFTPITWISITESGNLVDGKGWKSSVFLFNKEVWFESFKIYFLYQNVVYSILKFKFSFSGISSNC